jgi:ABC-type sulfate transport system permease component
MIDTTITLALIVAVQAIATAYLNRRVKDVVQPIHKKVEKIAEKIGVSNEDIEEHSG